MDYHHLWKRIPEREYIYAKDKNIPIKRIAYKTKI
jgi:hypothetical protein